jgi:hypothetical protein
MLVAGLAGALKKMVDRNCPDRLENQALRYKHVRTSERGQIFYVF